jgi:hypothetical protein
MRWPGASKLDLLATGMFQTSKKNKKYEELASSYYYDHHEPIGIALLAMKHSKKKQ